jgi:putative spermidine/putrescine transport system permease protein
VSELSLERIPISRKQTRKTVSPLRVISYVIMVIIVIESLLPLIPIMIWAFGFRWLYPSLLPAKFSLHAWDYVFSKGSHALEATLTAGLIAIIVTILSLFIGVPAGRALGLHKFRGKQLIEFLIIAPEIVPGIAVVMGIHILFIKLGLANTLIGVALVHLIGTTPYVVLVLAGIFANYQPEFEEQARTLGASPFQTFIHVTFPAIFPGTLVAGMFAFIISWDQYIVTLLIGGGKVVTVPLLLVNFASGNNNPVTAALCLLFMAPSIIFLIVSAKYITGENAALGGIGV